MNPTGAKPRYRPHAYLLVIVLGIVLALGETAVSQEVLTNDAIVQMVRVGLSEGVIVAKIQSSPTKFDVKTEDLVALKKAGVSDRVIETMVQRGSSATASPAPVNPFPGAPPRTPRVPGMPGQGAIVYHVVADKQIELTGSLGEIQSSSAFMSYKQELVLPGRKASYRVTERQPVFLSSVSPAEAPLARLKPGGRHDDRNLNVASGKAVPYGGSTVRRGVRTEDRVEVESERDPSGFYRIKPRQPLDLGEYAFVVTIGVPGGAASRVFDFGVD